MIRNKCHIHTFHTVTPLLPHLLVYSTHYYQSVFLASTLLYCIFLWQLENLRVKMFEPS